MVSTKGLLTDRNKDNSLISACFKCVPAMLLNAVTRVCPGYDAEEVSIAEVSGWTIATSRASGYPSKFDQDISRL